VQFRDAVLYLAPAREGGVEHGPDYAIGLARAHECAVTALVCKRAVLAGNFAEGVSRPADEDSRRAERTAEAFAARAREAGISFRTVTEQCYSFGIGEVFADYARVHDIAILGVSAAITREQKIVAEVVLFGSGRPLVLVPESSRSFAEERILIAWDATPAVVHAISGAMPQLKVAREVVVVSVTDDKAFRPGQSGVELCRHLARHGVRTTFEAVQRSNREVSSVLLDAAQAHGADLMVMGGYAHSTLRGLIFGSATKGIFEHPIPHPILMAH
jgi:nucleotide-binding universal stress UspA family protein